MIELDGSVGEGGGQILRSALSLAMITGQAFRIKNIRAKRSKPGLMRQHLVAVQAAAQVCGANLGHANVGSLELEFIPGQLQGGEYEFAIGSAGSCTLVLQTLLPALLFAEQPSVIRISGGTHNAMAPPFHFLQRSYARVLAQMGVKLELELQRFGFYPAGGGKIEARIWPGQHLQALQLNSPGERKAAYCESFIAAVPKQVAERELTSVGEAMGWQDEQLLLRGLPADQGPGNALLVTLEQEHVTEVFCAFGEKMLSSENVAKKVVREVRDYLTSGAALAEHLADQVMLPFALAGAGSFTTNEISQHSLTNAMVIEQFLPVKFTFGKSENIHTCTVHSLS